MNAGLLRAVNKDSYDGMTLARFAPKWARCRQKFSKRGVKYVKPLVYQTRST